MVGFSEDIRKPSSDGDVGESSATGAKSDWRRRERRRAQKYFGKRLTDADHQLIKNYAQSLDLDMSDLIAPYVDKILKQARAHARQTTSALAS